MLAYVRAISPFMYDLPGLYAQTISGRHRHIACCYTVRVCMAKKLLLLISQPSQVGLRTWTLPTHESLFANENYLSGPLVRKAVLDGGVCKWLRTQARIECALISSAGVRALNRQGSEFPSWTPTMNESWRVRAAPGTLSSFLESGIMAIWCHPKQTKRVPPSPGLAM